VPQPGSTGSVSFEVSLESRRSGYWLQREAESDITILGSGSLVKELAQAGLVDAFQFVVSPVALGAGMQLFAGLDGKLELALETSKAFKNGMIVSSYVPRAKKR